MKPYTKTERALVDLVITQGTQTAYGSMALMILTSVVLWPFFGATKVGLWLLAGIIFVFVRVVIFERLSDGRLFTDDYLSRERVTALCLAIAGAHWGVAAWLFLDPSNANLYAFVICAILGVVSATIGSASPRPNLWLAFAISEFVIVIAKFLALDYFPLAMMSVVFTSGVYFVVRSVGKRIETSITKDFQNAELLVEVRKAKDLAEEANIEKSYFMAATSHDLRQPLHAQGLLLEALKGQKLAPFQNDILQKMEQSNNALHTLFNSLLEISQLDAGTIEINNSHQSLLSICQQIAVEFEPLASAKKLTIEVSGNECAVFSDPILLNRIIRNLISNAVKYTEQGKIELNLSTQDASVVLSVKDTGIGIPKEEQENIFKEYKQLNNDSRDRQKGVGLGLALVRRMCELLELKISVESALGEGACFTLILPLGDETKIIKDKEEGSSSAFIEGLHIVLVDDELPILDAMGTLFNKWGCQCHTYSNVEAAEQALRDNVFSADIIISDYRLGDNINGVECIERLRKSCGTKIPAVLLSGDTDPNLLNDVQNAGFYMLHKPLKPAKLRNVISLLLHNELGDNENIR